MIIFNEQQYIEDIINRNQVSVNKIGKTRIMTLLNIYYKNDINWFCNVLSICQRIYPLFFEEKYGDKIKKIHEKVIKDNIEFRPHKQTIIYQSDINKIQSLSNEKLQKLYFTMIVLARWYNNEGWIGAKDRIGMDFVFQLANVRASRQDKCQMYYSLYDAGYIQYSKKNSSLNAKVNLEHDDKIVMTISVYKNLGNQYLDKYKDGWKMCTVCGKMYKIKNWDYSSKYCNECAYNIKLQQVINCKQRNYKLE